MKNVLGPASGQVWNRTDPPPQQQKRSPWTSSEPDRSRVQPVDFETDNPQTAAESSGQVRNRTDPFRNQTAETPPPVFGPVRNWTWPASVAGCRAGPIRNLTGWRAGPGRNPPGPLAPERLPGVTRSHSKPDWSQRPARACGAQKNPAGCRPHPLCTPRGGGGRGKGRGGRKEGGGWGGGG